MGQILIRNIDEAVLKALKERAVNRRSSLEEEARRALATSVGLTRSEAVARVEAVRARIKLKPGPSILDDLRTDRARDR